MSIRYSYPIYFSALLLLLAACTQDELTDDTRLPEGQYPLQIAAVTLGVEGGEAQPWGAPQTRVSENGDGTGSVWDWNGTEMIGVQLGGETTTYTLNADKTLSTDAPLYWQNTQTATVTAWYPATDGTLNLGDQSQNLAYLLSGTGTGDYLTPVTLTFAHRLAKVRVTPTGDALGEVQSLQLYTYTQCTYEKGTVVQGSQEGWIEMKKCEYTENGNAITCWEANVVPGYEITKLMANNDNKERDLSTTITPEAGSYYNITLDKDKGYTDDGQGNYTVTSAEGLKNIAKLVNEEGKTDIDITLTGNITLTGEWTPIGTSISNAYTGTFDGGGHTITGLTVTTNDEYAGLFGYLSNFNNAAGTVKNVVMDGIQITCNHRSGYAGGVVGYSWGTIENCSVSGSVSATVSVGGVVGVQRDGSITGCSSSATVKGTLYVGGVAGWTNFGATLTACYATGNVIIEIAPTQNISGGGLVGFNDGISLLSCYATGNVTSTGSSTGYVHIGGFLGDNYTTVTACYWKNNHEQGIGYNRRSTKVTEVDGTSVTWQNAVDAMNTALQNKGSEWRYELKGALPTLRKQ